MKCKQFVNFGEVTILVNVPGLPYTTNTGFTLLTLTGTILGETDLCRCNGHCSSNLIPPTINVKGEIEEEDEFLLVRVRSAILPNGFPLTLTQVQRDVLINTDYIIMVLPATT